MPDGDPQRSLIGPGYKALSLVNWVYCQELIIADGTMPRQRQACDMAYLESCGASLDFSSDCFDPDHGTWELGFERLLRCKLDRVVYEIDRLLDVVSGCPEAKELRAAILRLSRTPKSSFNPKFGSKFGFQEGVDRIVRKKILIDADSGGEFLNQSCPRGGFPDQEVEEVEAYYDRGEGRGKWRWTSQWVRSTYCRWAGTTKRPRRPRYSPTIFSRGAMTPLPDPEVHIWGLLGILPESLCPM